jgi:hypothetical protein
MTRALARAAASGVLRTPLTARIDGYSYQIADAALTVSDGREKLRVPIEWAFGQGTVGTTFLFRRDGRWYESRVSYFSALHGLDLTMGAQSITPHNVAEAAGRPVPPAELLRCFDCHATNVTRSPAADVSAALEGVQCERCHQAAAAHLAQHTSMRKLGALSAEEMSEFCGQCHRTWSQIAANGPRGIQNIRFQPYRLANSKCYDAANRRIRCTACHDPHRDLETSPAAYDAKCAACHAVSSTARTCRVATKDCVTCHMPRLDLPGAHRAFTDHWIRIVKPGEAYPD